MNTLPKYFVINVFLTLCISNSFSQKPVIGIKVGVAFANSTINYAGADPYRPKTSGRTGPLGGLYVDIPSGEKIIFRPGIEMISKGLKDEYNYPVIFTYVDFPISILYKISYPNGHLIVGGGPSIAVPIKDYYSQYSLKTELGLNGLIGYELPIGFSLNLNYIYGLSNASKNNENIKKISNRYLGISLGYSF